MSQKRIPSNPEFYDAKVVSRIERVAAPKQARSRESLTRVLSALEQLLEEQSFDDISIAEISKTAQCSVASIYARFKDKRSILVALHESLRERMWSRSESPFDPQHWVGKTMHELTLAYCQSIARFYREHAQLVAATLSLGDLETWDRAAESIQQSANAFGAAARQTMDGEMLSDAQVLLGVRAVTALMQQECLLYSSRSAMKGDTPSVAELAQVLAACLQPIPSIKRLTKQ